MRCYGRVKTDSQVEQDCKERESRDERRIQALAGSPSAAGAEPSVESEPNTAARDAEEDGSRGARGCRRESSSASSSISSASLAEESL